MARPAVRAARVARPARSISVAGAEGDARRGFSDPAWLGASLLARDTRRPGEGLSDAARARSARTYVRRLRRRRSSPSATRGVDRPGAQSARSRSHGERTATAINPSAEASCLSCLSVLEWSRVLTMCLSGGRRDSPPSQPRRVVSVWPIIAKQPLLRDPHWPVTFPEPDRPQISPAPQRWQGFVYGISLHGVPTIGRSVRRGPKKVFINLPSTSLSDVGVGRG